MSGTDFLLRKPAQLAEKCQHCPAPTEKAFFTNSGTEAIEAPSNSRVTPQARQVHRLLRLLSTARTMGALSLTASKSTQRKGFGALLAGVEHIPYPNAYRCAHDPHSGNVWRGNPRNARAPNLQALFDPEEVAAIVIGLSREKAAT